MDSPLAASTSQTVTVTSAPRPTPTPSRVKFSEVLASSAGSLVRGAEAAISSLPGAPMVALALRGGKGSLAAPGLGFGGGGLPNMGGPLQHAMAGGAPAAAAGLGGSGGTAAEGPTGVGSGAGTGTGDGGIESSLAQSQEMNLYYLQVQEAVNAQNRTFSTLSNVMKAEHDTVKNAIGNIR